MFIARKVNCKPRPANESASEFVTTMRTPLTTIGVDLDLSLLQKLTIDSWWITNDEKWKAMILDRSTADRKYADEIREAVRQAVRAEGGVVNSGGEALYSSQTLTTPGGTGSKKEIRLWLFSVRENRVSLLRPMSLESSD